MKAFDAQDARNSEKHEPSAVALAAFAEARIAEGDLDTAERFLHETEPSNASEPELRRLAHLRGRIHLHRGAWELAIAALRAARDAHGPHVGLLADLTAALYLAGRSKDWGEAVDEFAREFARARPRLSPISLARACAALGKHLEERGHVARALELYEEAMANGSVDDERWLHAATLHLRLRAILGETEATAALLSSLEARARRAPASQLSSDLQIERQQAQIIGEAAVAGLAPALERLSQILRQGFAAADVRTAIFDLTELWLLDPARDEGLRPLLSGLAENAEAVDGFEATGAERLRAEPVDWGGLTANLAGLPRLGALRALAIARAGAASPEMADELGAQMQSLLETLDQPSARLLARRYL